jgi:hypothetical protein
MVRDGCCTLRFGLPLRVCLLAVGLCALIGTGASASSAATVAARAAAGEASGAASDGLTIQGFIRHFFSYRPVGHGQVAGYDNSHDGVIDTQQEPYRVDRRQHVWQAVRFLHAVDAHTGADVFITRSDMRQYLASFDGNGNGRIDVTGGEFSRLYRAIWHKRPPRTASYMSFERRFYGG